MTIQKRLWLVAALLLTSVTGNAVTEKEFDDLQKQCELKDGNACRRIGYEYILSDGKMPLNTKVAIQYFQMGCDLKNAQACVELGVLYSDGRDVEQNYEKTKHYYQLACDYGDTDICDDVAKVGTKDYIDGQNAKLEFLDYINSGVAYHDLALRAIRNQQYDKATALFKKSCSQNFQPSCQILKEVGELKDE